MFEFSQTADHGMRIALRTKSFEAGNLPEFNCGLAKHCPRELREVEIDFSGVEMIDSSGIGALLSVHKRLKGDGARVSLNNVQPAVVSVIELLRLHQVFDIAVAEEISA